jgi:hypothetical protein
VPGSRRADRVGPDVDREPPREARVHQGARHRGLPAPVLLDEGRDLAGGVAETAVTAFPPTGTPDAPRGNPGAPARESRVAYAICRTAGLYQTPWRTPTGCQRG